MSKQQEWEPQRWNAIERDEVVLNSRGEFVTYETAMTEVRRLRMQLGTCLDCPHRQHYECPMRTCDVPGVRPVEDPGLGPLCVRLHCCARVENPAEHKLCTRCEAKMVIGKTHRARLLESCGTKEFPEER